MGVFYETIPDSLVPWIKAQQMLWVGTAPLSGEGHINISPKGGQKFGIIDERTFWYMDLTGSGVETHAHLHEEGNGRICVMFMAFTGPPKIVRIWGDGRAIENGTPEFSAFVTQHKVETTFSSRSIILVNVHQCGTSCGFSVPYYDFVGHRDILDKHFLAKEKKFNEGKEEESMDRYWAFKSQLSIDGLPGMKRGYEFAKQNGVQPLKKMVGPYAPGGDKRSSGREKIEPVHLLLVLLLGIIIGGAMALSVVTPERLQALRGKSIVV
ncbi:signal transduction histidine kinase [Stemphylium lycopersici]|uniref:Signal transduction histidine kinase n=1 Tax=Stemphylium lycopersici TaxID=183478 RepID=A0A364N1D6_STELY|nr:signal transduction histidine kinase [Stemphylium lycopersici]RAR09180.1 signal transduction histidine kinase [Stemphylium lycopersici]